MTSLTSSLYEYDLGGNRTKVNRCPGHPNGSYLSFKWCREPELFRTSLVFSSTYGWWDEQARFSIHPVLALWGKGISRLGLNGIGLGPNSAHGVEKRLVARFDVICAVGALGPVVAHRDNGIVGEP